MQIVQIATGLPPKIDGVGDYAANLALALRDLGIETCFLIPRRGGAEPAVPFATRPLASATPGALAAALAACGTDRVLLHFSGYGYAHWGLCWWLAEGLRRWRHGGRDRRLVTVFHELYATGPVWRASFWTSPPQRLIARHLATLSDGIVATTEWSAEKIRRWKVSRTPVVIPVFSNVGEPDAPLPLGRRHRQAVVFGQRPQRTRAYQRLARMKSGLWEQLKCLGVDRIVDIGPPLACSEQVSSLPVTVLGQLPPCEISAVLSDARLGFLHYPPLLLTKSGIFASYLSHGLLAVNLSSEGVSSGGLVDGEQYVGCGSDAPDSYREAESIAVRGYQWYSGHTLRRTAHAIAEQLS
ncbi:MAG: glycosyltransferase [Rhizobiales bacterium]|nr:glycosyltransferase [Hyphomicrobiales bacterium]